MNKKVKDGSFVVIFKDNSREEVFLVYRSDMPIWNLPGGGIEINETPEKAAVREAFEETGLILKIRDYLGKYNSIDITTGGTWNTTYLYSADITSGNFVPEFPGCKGEWFNVYNLPNNIQSISLLRIKDALAYKGVPFMKRFNPEDIIA